MRDIARQAGVSVATVSYVINGRDDQRISSETKKKVLQIINLLDYKPNSSAKSLATNKTYNVALYLPDETSLYKRFEQLTVAKSLAAVLKKHGYHLLLQNSSDISQLDYADAIFCYDTDSAFFLELGDKNFIPLISIDGLMPTPLQIFFQICTDYARLKKLADDHFGADSYSLVLLEPNNSELKKLICDTFKNVVFVNNSIPDFEGNIAYFQTSLQSSLGEKAYCIPYDMQSKTELVMDCFNLAVNRVPDCTHVNYI